MSSGSLKLSYNAAQFRVRVECSARELASHPTFPKDTIARAIAKLQSEKEKNSIAHIFDLSKSLEALWQNLHAAKPETLSDQILSFTVAWGVPRLSGLKITVPKKPQVSCVITIDAPAAVAKTWHAEWIFHLAKRDCEKAGLNIVPHFAHIHGALTRVQFGMKVQNTVIGIAPVAAEMRASGKGHAIAINKQRQEMTLVVSDAKYLQQAGAVSGLINQCAGAYAKVAADDPEYQILKQDLQERLRLASIGIERFGIGLPLVLLVGWSPKQANAVVVPANYPGKGKLNLEINPEQMEAKITGFDMAWYENTDFSPSKEWLQFELEAAPITFGKTEALKKLVDEAIAQKKDLNGMVVAQGDPGHGSQGPFLHKSFMDVNKLQGSDGAVLDIREMQQRTLVKVDQLVAQIKFKTPAVIGKNLMGKDLARLEDEVLQVSLGEGIEEREPGKYFATVDGIPQVDESSVAISRVFVHKGDVNLRTGNIRFDGNVEVTGSIDSGATVEVTGNLTVTGTIRDAYVKVGGDLEARMGIVTGDVGKVHVLNHVVADFMENSTLVCGGNLTVKKVILNSRIVAGGTITLDQKSGILAGGSVSSRGSIITGKLGFPKGATTELNIGVDWRAELRLRIRKSRLEKVEKAHESDRQQLRELSRRKDTQLAAKHKEMMESLKNRITKGRLILEKVRKHVEQAQAALTYDNTSTVTVGDVLFSNCSILIGGDKIPVMQDVAAVKVQAKKVKGSHIVALQEDAPPAGDKAEGNGEGAPPASAA